MALEKMNSTVNKFITDVLQFVIRNPHHVVRLQTTRINIICSGKELLRMLVDLIEMAAENVNTDK